MNYMRLVIKENDWKDLRSHLLREDRLERQAFLEMGFLLDDNKIDLFLHRILPVPDESYIKQTTVQVMPDSEFTVKAYNSFHQAGVPVHGHVHSHPFSIDAQFSEIDKHCRKTMVSGLRGVKEILQPENTVFCFLMVMGTSEPGCYGELVDLKGNVIAQLAELNVIGATMKKILLNSKNIINQKQEKNIGLFSSISLFNRKQNNRFNADRCKGEENSTLNRNVRLLGEAGQDRLGETHLVICGCGGVGAMLIASLRGMGIGKYTLIDPEKLEKSNLNRFPGAGQEDVGEYKVNILRREILRVFPEAGVSAIVGKIEDMGISKHLYDADIFIAAVDGMAPRAELQVLAARFLKPLFDIGSGVQIDPQGNVKRMGSQVIVYLPGGPCLKCQGMDIFRPEAGLAGEIRKTSGYVEGTDMTPTSVAFINSVISGYAADMVISYLTGLRAIPSYLEFDQWSWQMKVRKFERRSNCTVCGENGIEGKGVSAIDE